MKICNIPKNSQVSNTWFMTTPIFLRSHILNTFGRSMIQKIDGTCYIFHPKYIRHSLSFQHASSQFYDCFILPFNNPILLRSVPSSELMSNAIFFKKNFKFMRHIFTTLIGMKFFYHETTLFLNQGLENFETS